MSRQRAMFYATMGLLALTSAPLTVSAANTSRATLGINMSPYLDYDPLKLYADAIKSARGFYGVYFSSPEVPLDENGWPLADGGTVLWAGAENMSGRYKLCFTTQNPAKDARTVTVGWEWRSATLSNQQYDAATNTVSYDVNVPEEADGLLRIYFTNTSGGVKNVKLMRPLYHDATQAHDTSEMFSRQAKALLSKFRVLRFMQPLNTLPSNMVANWADRTPPGYATPQARTFQGGRSGIPYEHAIQLCNELDADLFLNIQFLATDDYVRQLANLVKNTLKPELKVYTEYSNELWNFYGYDAGRNHDSAVAEVNRGGSPLNFDGSGNTYYWGWRRTAKRGMEISNIFREVFGDAAMMTRVRPLLMAQISDGQGSLSQGLKLMWGYYNNPTKVANPRPPSYYFYGAGGALYYGPYDTRWGGNVGTVTLDNYWNSGTMGYEGFSGAVRGDLYLCATFGLKRVAYEGGPGLDDTQLDQQAWADPRMTTAVINHHVWWEELGADLLTYFTVANYGTSDVQWSFIHYIEEPNTPKMKAIDSLNARGGPLPPRTYGHLPPVAIPGSNVTTSAEAIWGTPPAGTPSWSSYVIRVEEPGTYGISLNLTGASGNRVSILVDGNPIDTITLAGGTITTPVTHVFLPTGLHGVIVCRLSGNTTINTVNVSVVALGAGRQVAPAGAASAAVPFTVRNGRIELAAMPSDGVGLRYSVSTLSGRVLQHGVLGTAQAGRTAALGVRSAGSYVVTVGGRSVVVPR